ncbi:MAG: hypothetical protein HOP30_16325 [Cyclobacteriaceae bacterium]|nr:hypothetical protein [Cyclobacteriaceae bacterium]
MLNFIMYSTLLIHGLIHFIGFGEAFQLLPTPQFTRHVSKSFGIFWLGIGMLFLLVFVLAMLQLSGWWYVLLATVAFSQALILIYWHDAKYGSIPNALLVVIYVMNIAG